MPPQKILITGGSGFIGSELCALLVRCGHEVSLLGRGGQRGTNRRYCEARNLNFYRYDQTIKSIENCLAQTNPDVIFHLATHYVRENGAEDVESLIDANVLFTSLLLECMAPYNCSEIIMAGSYWQYENGKTYSPANLYAATKSAAEAIAVYYAEKHKFNAKFLYIPDTYGPNDSRDKLIGNIFRSVEGGRSIKVMKPLNSINLIYVSDVADAFLHCASLKGNGVQRWRIESSEQIRILDLIDGIRDLLKPELHKLIELPTSPPPKNVIKNPAFAPVLPNWSAKIKIKDGLKKTFESVGRGS